MADRNSYPQIDALAAFASRDPETFLRIFGAFVPSAWSDLTVPQAGVRSAVPEQYIGASYGPGSPVPESVSPQARALGDDWGWLARMMRQLQGSNRAY
jgi:hypothetical protein